MKRRYLYRRPPTFKIYVGTRETKSSRMYFVWPFFRQYIQIIGSTRVRLEALRYIQSHLEPFRANVRKSRRSINTRRWKIIPAMRNVAICYSRRSFCAGEFKPGNAPPYRINLRYCVISKFHFRRARATFYLQVLFVSPFSWFLARLSWSCQDASRNKRDMVTCH